MKKTILIITSLLFLSGCTTQTPVSKTPASPTTGAERMKNYTLVEVGKHNNKQDCWMVIEGKVYDVTPSTTSGKHPGGEAILEGCGKDATELFNTRPMGSKTPHSDNARKFLEGMQIGQLADN